jgi:hypothetical protein
MMRSTLAVVAVAAFAASACSPRSDTRADAQSSGAATANAMGAPSPGAPGSFTAEVVEVDAKGSTIVLRNASASGSGASAGEKSVKVGGAAAAELGSLRRGDQVVIACDSAQGTAGSSSAGAAARPNDIGPAGGNDGIGPGGTTDELRTCSSIVSLMKVASATAR